jgi:hypothetical protein
MDHDMHLFIFVIGSMSGLKYATTCDKPLSHYINIAAPFSTKDVNLTENQVNSYIVFLYTN